MPMLFSRLNNKVYVTELARKDEMSKVYREEEGDGIKQECIVLVHFAGNEFFTGWA